MKIETEILVSSKGLKPHYHIGVAEEIRRCLVTRNGSIPMNPEYGSNLYLYRDRGLDDATRIAVINETYDAIEYAVKRINPTRVQILPTEDGRWQLKIEVTPA